MIHEETVGSERRVLLEILQVFTRRWLFVGGLALVTTFGALFQHVLLPKYVAQGSLIIRTDNNSPLLRVFGKITGSQSDIYNVEKAPSYEMMKILHTNEFNKFIMNRIKKDKNDNVFPTSIILATSGNGQESTVPEIANFIISNFNFKQFDDIITIYGYSNKPDVAEAIAMWTTEAAQQYLIEYEGKEVSETEHYLREEIEHTNERIVKLNDEIDKYRNDPNIAWAGSEGHESIIDKSISKIRTELEMVHVRMREIEILDKDYRVKIGAGDRSTADITGDGAFLQMRGRLVDSIKDLAAESEQLNAKERALAARLATLVSSLKPQNEQAVFDFKRQLDLEHNLRQELQKQIYATRIYQIAAENKIRLYENVMPNSATRSITLVKKIGISVFLSLALALLIVVIWEQMYPVLSLKHDFLHNGVRFLGSIPVLFQRGIFTIKRRQTKSMFSRMATVMASGVRTPESTSIQFLAARILHNLEKQWGARKGAICIISCNSGEGKTLISNCLSVALGDFGARVLLVEGDTLRSKGENMFGIRPGEGFAEVLENKAELKSLVKETEFKNVHYLCRGKTHPEMRVLQSNAYSKFIQKAKKEYDIVIVDTPAFTVGPEALFMAGNSDMGLVIAAAHHTMQDEFADLVETLHSRGMKNLFAILNRAGVRASSAEAYYYADKLSRIKEDVA